MKNIGIFLKGDSSDLGGRILHANIECEYSYDCDGNIPPDDLYDEFLEVEDWGYKDCKKFRTYKCKIKTTLQPKEFRKTLYRNILSSTRGLLAGCRNLSEVQEVVIKLDGSLEDYEYDFEKVNDTPVVIKDKAYFQMKCKKSGTEVLKEITILE